MGTQSAQSINLIIKQSVEFSRSRLSDDVFEDCLTQHSKLLFHRQLESKTKATKTAVFAVDPTLGQLIHWKRLVYHAGVLACAHGAQAEAAASLAAAAEAQNGWMTMGELGEVKQLSC